MLACLLTYHPHVPSEPASTAQTEPPHGYCDLHCSYSADSCRAKRYPENASDTVHRLFCRCRSPCAGLGTPLSGVRYHLPFPCGLHCPNCPLAHILQSHPKAECAAKTEFPFSEHRYQSAFQIPHAESSRNGCGQTRNIPAYPEKSHWA